MLITFFKDTHSHLTLLFLYLLRKISTIVDMMAKKETSEKKKEEKKSPQAGEYQGIEVKNSTATIDGVQIKVHHNISDGVYDVKVWSDGQISFYIQTQK